MKQVELKKMLNKKYRYNINEKFFEEWSNDMAYVLGFLYADGSMERNQNGYLVDLTLQK